jgi:ABC-type dipeptide/oligopeptide/nickel transport system ATPase subunit
VALARYCIDPPLLILDEVMSQLDTASKQSVANILRKLIAWQNHLP